MPRAGWCRECGEWVWVDIEGACQFGHEPGCVERVHEQQVEDGAAEDHATSSAAGFSQRSNAAEAAGERPFGVGDLPAELRRFNWGAFFLPLFWGATYGSWQVLGVWFIALVSPTALGSMLASGSGALDSSAVIGISVASEVVAGLARLWAGANANRLVWRREALRLSILDHAKPRFSVERFVGRQRTWMVWSAIVIGVTTVLSVPLTMSTWSEYGLTYVGPLMPVAWLVAEVVLGRWLDAGMRAEGAQDPA